MDIEIFRDELNARFLPYGKLNVATTTNVAEQPMPRYESIWMISATSSAVEFHITGLQSANPLVTADVTSQLS